MRRRHARGDRPELEPGHAPPVAPRPPLLRERLGPEQPLDLRRGEPEPAVPAPRGRLVRAAHRHDLRPVGGGEPLGAGRVRARRGRTARRAARARPATPRGGPRPRPRARPRPGSPSASRAPSAPTCGPDARRGSRRRSRPPARGAPASLPHRAVSHSPAAGHGVPRCGAASRSDPCSPTEDQVRNPKSGLGTSGGALMPLAAPGRVPAAAAGRVAPGSAAQAPRRPARPRPGWTARGGSPLYGPAPDPVRQALEDAALPIGLRGVHGSNGGRPDQSRHRAGPRADERVQGARARAQGARAGAASASCGSPTSCATGCPSSARAADGAPSCAPAAASWRASTARWTCPGPAAATRARRARRC